MELVNKINKNGLSLTEAQQGAGVGVTPTNAVTASGLGASPDAAKMAGTQAQRQKELQRRFSGAEQASQLPTPTKDVQDAIDKQGQLKQKFGEYRYNAMNAIKTAQAQQVQDGQFQGEFAASSLERAKAAGIEQFPGSDAEWSAYIDTVTDPNATDAQKFEQLRALQTSLLNNPNVSNVQDMRQAKEQIDAALGQLGIDAEAQTTDIMKAVGEVADLTLAEANFFVGQDGTELDQAGRTQFATLLGLEDAAALEGLTIQQLEDRIVEIEAEEYNEVDELRAIIDDPSVSPALKDEALARLNDLGSVGLVSSDAEMDALISDIQAQQMVSFGDQSVDINELFEDPTVNAAVYAALSTQNYEALQQSSPELASLVQAHGNAFADLVQEYAGESGAMGQYLRMQQANLAFQQRVQDSGLNQDLVNQLGFQGIQINSLDEGADAISQAFASGENLNVVAGGLNAAQGLSQELLDDMINASDPAALAELANTAQVMERSVADLEDPAKEDEILQKLTGSNRASLESFVETMRQAVEFGVATPEQRALYDQITTDGELDLDKVKASARNSILEDRTSLEDLNFGNVGDVERLQSQVVAEARTRRIQDLSSSVGGFRPGTNPAVLVNEYLTQTVGPYETSAVQAENLRNLRGRLNNQYVEARNRLQVNDANTPEGRKALEELEAYYGEATAQIGQRLRRFDADTRYNEVVRPELERNAASDPEAVRSIRQARTRAQQPGASRERNERVYRAELGRYSLDLNERVPRSLRNQLTSDNRTTKQAAQRRLSEILGNSDANLYQESLRTGALRNAEARKR